jgi:hypothetical protein
VVFDQFPRDHAVGPERGNDTDALILHIAEKAAFQELKLRLVLLGYKRPYLQPGSDELLVGLDYLSADELEAFFRIVQQNFGCPIADEVDGFLRDYRTHKPGSAHCRLMLQQIPGIITKMRKTRTR